MSQNPTKLLRCVASQTYPLFYDMINLTAYTGLILPALGLSHLGRVSETLPFTPAPSAMLQKPEPWSYQSYPAYLQLIAEPLAVGAH